MEDCDGNVLQIGDRVGVQAYNYKNLKAHRVIGFTSKKVRVDQDVHIWKWNGKDFGNDVRGRLVDPERLAKLYRQEV